MEEIILSFENWSSRKMKDCRIRSCRNMLWNNKIHLSSGILLILGRGVGIEFMPFKLKEDSNLILWSLIGSNVDMQKEIFESLHIRQEEIEVTNDEGGVERIIRCVNRNIPVVISFNASYLASFDEQKKHMITAYSVAPLVGYNMEKRLFYLDFYRELIGESAGLYAVPMDKLLMAIEAHCVPYSTSKMCFTLQMDDGIETWISAHIKELVIDGLQDICKKMLYPCNPEMNGISGLQCFVQTLEIFLGEIERSNMSSEKINRILNLKIKYLHSSLTAGSVSFYRIEFGQALKEVSEWFSWSELESLGEDFLRHGKQWEKFCIDIKHIPEHSQIQSEQIAYTVLELKKLLEAERILFCALESRMKHAYIYV